MWTSGHNGDMYHLAHGYEATREAAMAAFAMVMVHLLEFQPGLLFLLLDQFTHLALCVADIRMCLCDDYGLLVDVAGKLLDLSFGAHRTSPVCG